MDNEKLRRNLTRAMWFYEAIVILTCLVAGAKLATSHGGELIMAIPLLLIAAAEMMRIPLSAWSIRLPLYGQIIGSFVLVAIAIGSFEGLSLAFEQFVNNRVIAVMSAENAVSDARVAIDAKQKALKGAEDQLDIAKKSLEDTNTKIADHSQHRPTGSGKCKTRLGAVYSCPDTKLEIHQWTNRSDELDKIAKIEKNKLNELSQSFAELTKEDMTPVLEKLRKAEQNLSNELLLSPMHRLAASVYGVHVKELTEQQFEIVKRYAVFGLAGAFAILSMLVSIVAHTPPVDGSESKVSRAIRSYFARLRKPVIRIKEIAGATIIQEVEKIIEVPGPEVVVEREVEKIVEVAKEIIVFKYIPVDYETGRKINPDMTLGEAVNLKAVKGGKA